MDSLNYHPPVYPCHWTNYDHSEFGHDKSLEIKPYGALPDQHRPLLLYARDGVSDLSAASETEILFANECLGECDFRICPMHRQIPTTISPIYPLPATVNDPQN